MGHGALLEELSAKLIEWFWEFGLQRDAANALSPSWLDQVYGALATGENLKASEHRQRMTMGIWGPSQAGKSTLLSQYLDRNAMPSGEGSALSWPAAGAPGYTRFSNVGTGGDAEDGVTCLNPYNFNSDASGCVTRYTLRTDGEVSDHSHPVEIVLMTPSQVMHALAAGYTTECTPATATGEVLVWSRDRFDERLSKLNPTNGQGVIGGAKREAFEQVRALANVLGLLIKSGEPRFQPLGANGAWDAMLRRKLVEHPVLIRDTAAVLELAQDLLWDNWPALNRALHELSTAYSRFRDLWQGRKVLCSMETASILLDIDSFNSFLDPRNPHAQRIKERIRSLSYGVQEDCVRIGHRHANRLIGSDRDFGLLQGLVRELRIPVRAEVVAQMEYNGFRKFIERVDILDFPGVALQSNDRTADALLDLKQIHADDPRMLTRLLKRGKTASIVASYAGTLDIDGFCILVRAQHFPAQPRQLISGIDMWWRASMLPHTSSDAHALPLFLVMTFFGQLVNNVITNRGTGNGLAPAFEMLRDLGPISASGRAITLATTYPQFPGGRIDGDHQQQNQACDLILQDPDFRIRFADEVGRRSFSEIFKLDGGTTYLFNVAYDRLTSLSKGPIFERLSKQASRQLLTLVEHALPESANEATRRQDLLDSVTSALTRSLASNGRLGNGTEDPVAKCSYAIRRLLEIRPDTLEPFPMNARQLNADITTYVHRQYRRWAESSVEFPEVELLGLSDAITRARLLLLLTEIVSVEPVRRWLMENFGAVRMMSDAQLVRRYVAMRMSNQFLAMNRSDDDTHPAVSDVTDRLETFCKYEEGQHMREGRQVVASPHFRMVVEPFQHLLSIAARAAVSMRLPQAGDDRLAEIKSRFSADVPA